jgi:hypothetical protein
MPVFPEYEALDAEEPRSPLLGPSSRDSKSGRGKDGSWTPLSVGDPDQDVDEHWDSLSTADSSDDEEHQRYPSQHTHFAQLFGGGCSLPKFLVSGLIPSCGWAKTSALSPCTCLLSITVPSSV